MEELYNQIIAMLNNHAGSVSVGVVLGLLGPKLIPFLKGFAAKTPTKADDLIVAGIEACLSSQREKISTMTVQELERVLTTPQISDLVRLRKARIAAEQAQTKTKT